MSVLKMKHGKDYFSPSQLKKLFISLGQLNAYLKKVWTASSSMELGTLVHLRLLEPEKYNKTIRVIDDKDICSEIGGARPTATKKYKEWKAGLESEAKENDWILISGAQDFIINKIYRDCVMAGIIDDYFTGGEAEKTVTGIAQGFDEEFPALCIIDYDKDEVSVDLKTTSKELGKFHFDANSLGYDIQAATTNGVNGKPFIFVVVQTVEPYDIGVFTCSENFMERGVWKVNTALQNYEQYEDEFSSQIIYKEL